MVLKLESVHTMVEHVILVEICSLVIDKLGFQGEEKEEEEEVELGRICIESVFSLTYFFIL